MNFSSVWCLALPLTFLGAAPSVFSEDGLTGPQFAGTDIFVGERDGRLITGDFNGDGLEDVIVASGSAEPGDWGLLLGNSAGSFDPVQSLMVDPRAFGGRSLDIDADGDLDLLLGLVFSSSAPRNVALLLGDGTGGFVDTGMDPGVGFSSSAFVDITGDGVPDAAYRTGTTSGEWRPGNGDGTFGAPVEFDSPSGYSSTPYQAGDINGDSFPDLVIGVRSNSTAILLGESGGFSQTVIFAPHDPDASSSPRLLRDFDGDGALDVIGWRSVLETVAVTRGNGDGTFQAPISRVFARQPTAVEVADMNGDGIPDLLVSAASKPFGFSSLSVVIGTGDGTLDGPIVEVEFDEDRTPFFSVLDVTQDGVPDVIALGHELRVIIGSPSGGFEGPTILEPDGRVLEIGSGNFDGDPFPDVLARSFAGPGNTNPIMTVYSGDGQGGLIRRPSQAYPGGLGKAFVMDVDDDGDDDIVLDGLFTGSFPILGTNDGAGNFSFGPFGAIFGARVALMEILDVDADGVLDIVAIDRLASPWGNLVIQRGLGGGGFQTTVDIELDFSVQTLRAADLDLDGWVDVVVGAANDSSPRIYYGQPDGSLIPVMQPSTPQIGGWGPIFIGDVAGDAAPELITGNLPTPPETGELAVWARRPDGRFEIISRFADRPSSVVGVLGASASLVDLDLDGNLDFVTTQGFSGGGRLRYLKGMGDGVFEDTALFGGGLRIREHDFVDLNGDGNLDLVVTQPFGPPAFFLHRASPRLRSYCEATPTSAGAPARVGSSGSRRVTAGDFVLTAEGLPAGELRVWFAGGAPTFRPLASGNLCIAGRLSRISSPAVVGPTGADAYPVDLMGLGVLPGTSIYFQCWFSDQTGTSVPFNFTDALEVLTLP